jgi:hypothetical protein
VRHDQRSALQIEAFRPSRKDPHDTKGLRPQASYHNFYGERMK